MNTLNFSVLSRLTMGDLYVFVRWIEAREGATATRVQLEEESPIRGPKLFPMLQTLQQFEFACQDVEQIRLTERGRQYARSDSFQSKVFVRESLLQFDPIKHLMECLPQSSNGRMSWRQAAEILDLEVNSTIGKLLEIKGFLYWGDWCGLFRYDKRRDEIVLINDLSPGNNIEALSQNTT